jgi:protein-disulfide isomerase
MLALAGVGLFLFVVAGQVFVQDRPTYLVEKPHQHGSPFVLSAKSADDFARSKAARWLCDNSIGIDLDEVPYLGAPGAKDVAVLMFDYTCPHCRKLRGQLGEVLRIRRELCVPLIVVPLSPECNKYVEAYEPKAAQDACALARLSLAVWRQRPDAFAEFDTWLTSGPQPPSLEVARARAAELLGQNELEQALSDPALYEQLERQTQLYENLHRGLLPKLLLPDVYIIGELRSTTEMIELLQRHLPGS